MKRKLTVAVVITAACFGLLAGCGQNNASEGQTDNLERNVQDTNASAEEPDSYSGGDDAGTAASELQIHFGDNGAAFTLQLEDNDTAKAIAGYVGSADWRLPIYHYDDYEGFEYFQYYDIPSRYEIPDHSEPVTIAKAGEVYYSTPNRIILFYQDAEISEEYTKVGTIDATEDFVRAVEENPVLEGWSNKIVLINDGE
jgi:hypothetical protein